MNQCIKMIIDLMPKRFVEVLKHNDYPTKILISK